MAIDLHCHTKLSDGSMGVEEVIALARRRNLSALAVTDHDTTASAVRAAVIGRRQGVRVIQGVELSTWDTPRNRKAHILCYLADTPTRLEPLCRQVTEGRKKAALEMVRKVMRYYPITPEMVAKCATGSTVVYKQHIMHALMDAGYADAIYGEVYDKLFSKEGSIQTTVEYPDTRDALELVRAAGGIAVLAHPLLYHNEELMMELTEQGLLDGVEAYHPSSDEKGTRDLVAYAGLHDLVVTGGTDFHGMYTSKPRPLGNSAIPVECVDALMACKKKQKQNA